MLTEHVIEVETELQTEETTYIRGQESNFTPWKVLAYIWIHEGTVHILYHYHERTNRILWGVGRGFRPFQVFL